MSDNEASTTTEATEGGAGRPPGLNPRLRALILLVIGAGAVSILTSLLSLPGSEMPTAGRLATATALFILGDTALLHIRFGHDHHSFTWSETAIVVGLVMVPHPWLRLIAAASVAVAHTVARRPRLKTAFNAMSMAVGALLARTVYTLFGGAETRGTSARAWVALGAAAITFSLWNHATVSAAVAFSQGLRFRTVHFKGLLLKSIVCVGNTALGILIVASTLSRFALMLLLPGLIVLLYLAYQNYLRAMQERDVWRLLQAATHDLVHVEPSGVARVVMDHSIDLLKAEFVELLLVETGRGGRALSFRRMAGGSTERREGRPEELAGAFWPRVQCELEPFQVAIQSAPATQRREMNSLGLDTCVIAPLMYQDRCLGALRIGFRGPVKLAGRDIQVYTTYANHVGSAVHNSRLFSEIREQALHDPLTGLPNRTLLGDRLEQALTRMRRKREHVAVLFIDIDRFKVINDSLGHHFGDQLIVAVAERIQHGLREGDTATRFGGDEFVVVCEDVADERQAMDIADRIAASIAVPFQLGREEIFVTVSIGVALAEGPGHEPGALVRDADAAMYQAKAKGSKRCVLFDSRMREQAIARLEMENDLRRAIEAGQLELYYQPNVAISSGAVVGVEALVRWNHPTRGLIPPSEFIPLAEETGLIGALGRWVVGDACRRAAQWKEEGLIAQDGFYVAVNVSPLQLLLPDLVEDVAGALEASSLDPAFLCLEITENALVEDGSAAIDVLRRLRALGIRLALDDFGTGYSALGYLPILPVDVLKIDRRFIGRLGPDPRDRAILVGMIQLAHALGLTVVAEGVETPAQLAELTLIKCDMGQGFYFAHPQPASSLEAFLRVWQTSNEVHGKQGQLIILPEAG